MCVQKYNCQARLKIVHKGRLETSEIYAAHSHTHDSSRDTSSIFKQKVVDKMKEACARGCPPEEVRLAVVDDLFQGNDKHEDVPSKKQVANEIELVSSPFSILQVIKLVLA